MSCVALALVRRWCGQGMPCNDCSAAAGFTGGVVDKLPVGHCSPLPITLTCIVQLSVIHGCTYTPSQRTGQLDNVVCAAFDSNSPLPTPWRAYTHTHTACLQLCMQLAAATLAKHTDWQAPSVDSMYMYPQAQLAAHCQLTCGTQDTQCSTTQVSSHTSVYVL